MNAGDKFSVAGIFKMAANPARKWWCPWRPKLIPTQELQTFVAQELVSKPLPGGYIFIQQMGLPLEDARGEEA